MRLLWRHKIRVKNKPMPSPIWAIAKIVKYTRANVARRRRRRFRTSNKFGYFFCSVGWCDSFHLSRMHVDEKVCRKKLFFFLLLFIWKRVLRFVVRILLVLLPRLLFGGGAAMLFFFWVWRALGHHLDFMPVYFE